MTLQNNDLYSDFRVVCAATARHAAETLRLAGRKVTPRTIAAMVTSASRNSTAREREYTDDSFCLECIKDASDRVAGEGTPEEKVLFIEAYRHFVIDLPTLSPTARNLLEAAFAGFSDGMRQGN